MSAEQNLKELDEAIKAYTNPIETTILFEEDIEDEF